MITFVIFFLVIISVLIETVFHVCHSKRIQMMVKENRRSVEIWKYARSKKIHNEKWVRKIIWDVERKEKLEWFKRKNANHEVKLEPGLKLLKERFGEKKKLKE